MTNMLDFISKLREVSIDEKLLKDWNNKQVDITEYYSVCRKKARRKTKTWNSLSKIKKNKHFIEFIESFSPFIPENELCSIKYMGTLALVNKEISNKYVEYKNDQIMSIRGIKYNDGFTLTYNENDSISRLQIAKLYTKNIKLLFNKSTNKIIVGN